MQAEKFPDAISPDAYEVCDSGDDSEHTLIFQMKKQKAGLQGKSTCPKKLAIEPVVI